MKTRDVHRAEPRRDGLKAHLIAEEGHDPYKARAKRAEPAVCKSCMAVLHGGRWHWTIAPLPDAEWDLCPACQRIKDCYPAGELTLSGAFLDRHGQEIVRLARNVEALERHQHPLQRIMDVVDAADHITITTTDIHLPRRIGHAIVSAYKGDLQTHYDEAGYFVRMTWRRDE